MTLSFNIQLCGAVPRAPPSLQFGSHGAPTSTHNVSPEALQTALDRSSSQSSSQDMPERMVCEPPAWAVPSKGDARLEPVCGCRQTPVDLSKKAVYAIGRSPANDVQLLHATSSRRHALLFHHSNGSTYLVDCHSAHGTYVNGVRITSSVHGGQVVPHKIRRGSMIRFGGPGAPCFVLKNFNFQLDDIEVDNYHAGVKDNTRYNALGTSAKDTLSLMITYKRSFDSMDTLPPPGRCTSPVPSPDAVMTTALVSPDDAPARKRRRVTFSQDPPCVAYPNLISPDLSGDECEA